MGHKWKQLHTEVAVWRCEQCEEAVIDTGGCNYDADTGTIVCGPRLLYVSEGPPTPKDLFSKWDADGNVYLVRNRKGRKGAKFFTCEEWVVEKVHAR